MLVLLAALSAQAAPPCEAPSSPSDVAASVSEANLAWATLDEEGFEAAVGQAKQEVACLDGVLSTDDAAAVHRIEGLRAFLKGDEAGARASFAAAAAAAPGYELSDKIAPRGGKLWRLYIAASEAERGAVETLEVPGKLDLWVDGRHTAQRVTAQPVIVQAGADAEDLSYSRYLAPGEAFVPPAAPMANLDTTVPRKPKRIDPLWIAAGGSGLATAGLFGGSVAARNAFERRPNRSTYNTTNGAYVASTGMAVVTGGLITAAVLRARKRR